ncbi:hypothetical protein SNEBB_007702 [Seison nebaliae]|nr:hypothetical protein SNEBB_007702 [Seison nebaliae]
MITYYLVVVIVLFINKFKCDNEWYIDNEKTEHFDKNFLPVEDTKTYLKNINILPAPLHKTHKTNHNNNTIPSHPLSNMIKKKTENEKVEWEEELLRKRFEELEEDEDDDQLVDDLLKLNMAERGSGDDEATNAPQTSDDEGWTWQKSLILACAIVVALLIILIFIYCMCKKPSTVVPRRNTTEGLNYDEPENESMPITQKRITVPTNISHIPRLTEITGAIPSGQPLQVPNIGDAMNKTIIQCGDQTVTVSTRNPPSSKIPLKSGKPGKAITTNLEGPVQSFSQTSQIPIARRK